jgi:hypothetical protein
LEVIREKITMFIVINTKGKLHASNQPWWRCYVKCLSQLLSFVVCYAVSSMCDEQSTTMILVVSLELHAMNILLWYVLWWQTMICYYDVLNLIKWSNMCMSFDCEPVWFCVVAMSLINARIQTGVDYSHVYSKNNTIDMCRLAASIGTLELQTHL